MSEEREFPGVEREEAILSNTKYSVLLKHCPRGSDAVRNFARGSAFIRLSVQSIQDPKILCSQVRVLAGQCGKKLERSAGSSNSRFTSTSRLAVGTVHPSAPR